MNRRLYNIMLGSLLLFSLYFDLNYIIYALIAIMFFEAITNIMIPGYLAKIPVSFLNDGLQPISSNPSRPCRINFHADRMWRILMGTILIISYILFFQYLWFVPWFLGFAILGAGVSDVCPMLEMIRFAGFKR